MDIVKSYVIQGLKKNKKNIVYVYLYQWNILATVSWKNESRDQSLQTSM